MPHLIRLRGPWRYAAHFADGEAPRDGDVKLPVVDAGFLPAGCRHVVYSRRFNKPTGLADRDRVAIRILDAEPTRVVVNDTECRREDGRYSITSALANHNQIEIDVPAGQVPTVQLEIDDADASRG